jgi:pseudouridine-5'-monophosphatase
MSALRPARAVIFDMDGVLLDTERVYTAVTQEIVGRFGKTFDWSVKGNMIGRPALDSARYLVEALALPLTPEEYLREREHRLEALMPTADAMPGARALVQALHRQKTPIALASSSSRRLYTLKTARHQAWFSLFDVVVLGDDPRVGQGKPAPDIFVVAAGDLGVPPGDCLVIEDAPSGVAAARAAGMQVIAVPDPAMDAARFSEATLVVTSLGALDAAALVT